MTLCINLNEIEDGIMRKDTTTAKITDIEIERDKQILKKRYMAKQYFGLSHLHDGAYRARFTTIVKTSGMGCLDKWRSTYFEGQSYWLRRNVRQRYAQASKRAYQGRGSPHLRQPNEVIRGTGADGKRNFLEH